jgi:hypothetical protein
MEKTSLEKSHSKVSNFKLTLIILCLSLFISLLWAGIFLMTWSKDNYFTIGIIVTAFSFVLSIFNFILIGKFTR